MSTTDFDQRCRDEADKMMKDLMMCESVTHIKHGREEGNLLVQTGDSNVVATDVLHVLSEYDAQIRDPSGVISDWDWIFTTVA